MKLSEAITIAKWLKQTRAWLPKRWAINWLGFVITSCEIRLLSVRSFYLISWDCNGDPDIMVAQNPISWLAHRCTPVNKNPGGCLFSWSALVMSPLWLALFEPCDLKQPLGRNKVPMFFWGPITGPGVIRNKIVASLRDSEVIFSTQPSNIFS